MPIIGSLAGGSAGGYGQRKGGPSEYIIATGGTITTVGDFKIHSFTGDGTFEVTQGTGQKGKVDYLVVAGGGSASAGTGGGTPGGGAGGLRIGSVSSPGSPPLVASGMQMEPGSYPVVVGAGAAGPAYPPADGPGAGRGASSSFNGITSAGGGGNYTSPAPEGSIDNRPGGSGGGLYVANAETPRALGNQPPVNPPQGNDAANIVITPQPGAIFLGGGGGGAVSAGVYPSPTGPTAGAGGNGLDVTPIFGASPQPFYGPTNGVYAGGGGGGSGRYSISPPGYPAGAGGSGGGGAGTDRSTATASAGTANTGGGGGGSGFFDAHSLAGAGGSGRVLIRYKFQN